MVFDRGKVYAHNMPGVDAYFGPLFQGIADGFASASVDIESQYIPVFDCLDYFRVSGVDGLILVAPPTHDTPALHQLFDAGVPFVAISASSSTTEDKHLPCVDTANFAGGRTAAHHLIELGHTRLACVNLGSRFVNQTDRMEGFAAAACEASLPWEHDSLVHEFEYEKHIFEPHVETWLRRRIAEDTVPTGIFACDYAMVTATMTVLARHSIDIPGQVSVIGFDDPSEAAQLSPPLTTMRQPVYEIGRRASERLVSAIRTGVLPTGTEILPTELIVRASTGAPCR